METLLISDFLGAIRVSDPKGREVRFENRHTASFILTVKGEIRFTYNGGSIVSCPEHGVFLPKGLTYTNKCLESAESYLINFDTLSHHACPEALTYLPEDRITEAFTTLQHLSEKNSFHARLRIFELLYRLADRLFPAESTESQADRILSGALDFIHKNCSDPSLTVRMISDSLFISEIYLRKLFSKKLGTTPGRFLTEVRMKKARRLALEKRAIGEIALLSGYSDVYQFSRAFKRFYGCPPSKIG